MVCGKTKKETPFDQRLLSQSVARTLLTARRPGVRNSAVAISSAPAELAVRASCVHNPARLARPVPVAGGRAPPGCFPAGTLGVPGCAILRRAASTGSGISNTKHGPIRRTAPGQSDRTSKPTVSFHETTDGDGAAQAGGRHRAPRPAATRVSDCNRRLKRERSTRPGPETTSRPRCQSAWR